MSQIQKIYLQHGDLGYLVEYSLSHKFATTLVNFPSLTITSIYDILIKLACIGSKQAQAKRKKFF